MRKPPSKLSSVVNSTASYRKMLVEYFKDEESKPSYDNHTQMSEWYNSIAKSDKPFDRYRFDLESINSNLNNYFYWSRDRALQWKEI